ncbi:MAG: ankyrin repeat domain-containing protein [Bdellovibrionota bacterium]
MKNIRSVYEWHKEQLWLQVLIISLGAIVLTFFAVHPLIQFMIYMVTVAKIILSLKLMNVNPGSVNDLENFSWKYYQSLPLSKKELYHLYLANAFFNFLPSIFFALCYHSHIADLFEVQPSTVLFWIPFGIVALFAFSVQSFIALVVYPRIQFSRVNKRTLLFQNLRNGLYYVTGFIYAGIGIGIVAKSLKLDYPELIKYFDFAGQMIFNRYSMFGFLILGTIWLYNSSFEVWLNEKFRTPKANWKALRDIPIMAGVVSFLVFPMTFVTTSTDGGIALHEAIIENRISEVKLLLKKGVNIDEVNENGFSPIMTAAYRGRPEVFQLLLDAGAKQDITLKSVHKNFQLQGMNLFQVALKGGSLEIVKKLSHSDYINKGYGKNDAKPLSHAAANCHDDIVEFLIENGAEINAVSKLGKTALHNASEQNCFPAVASLLEAGADPLIKDNKNKLAYELGRKGPRSPASFLERKTLKRLPQK